MMGYMKWLSITALAALFSISGAHAEVFGVKTVYVLPMAGGLDQYLALRLTSGGVLQVVTDPQKADAILTDGIGTRFEESLTELYGGAVSKDKDKDKEKSEKAGGTEPSHPAMQPLARGRGVVFLVNRSSRDVVWSTFARPKSSQPEELEHVAAKIVDRLAKVPKAR
jgi:hypothetical protein